MTKRRLLSAGLVVALWAPIFLLVGGLARGAGQADFAGWDMGAKATAFNVLFDSPSLGVPAHPTGELNYAYSEATLQSGPSAYGLGSILWPGQVVAALPAFLQSTIQTSCSCELPVAVPNYPIRAESFHPQGPATSSLDAGTMHMGAAARESDAEGTSYANKFNVPVVGHMGNVSSISTTGFDPDGAVSMAESTASDLSLVNGLIKIDSVITRATARSNGDSASVAGSTTILGAEVNGIGVRIDSDGVHVAGQNANSAAQQQALNSVLNQFGITMELASPIDTKQGAKASRALGGLLIRIKSSTLDPIITALPDNLEQNIRGQITLDQVVTVAVAPAVVSAGAAKNFVFTPTVPTIPTDTGTGGDTSVGGIDTLAPTDSGSGVTTPTSPSGSLAAPPQNTTVLVAKTFSGVPVWLVVVLVLLALASSRPLTMLADRVLARGGGTSCPEGAD